MRIRVLKSFSGYRVGQVFDWGDGMARIYIARGMAEAADQPAVERTVIDRDTEQAVIRPAVKRKPAK